VQAAYIAGTRGLRLVVDTAVSFATSFSFGSVVAGTVLWTMEPAGIRISEQSDVVAVSLPGGVVHQVRLWKPRWNGSPCGDVLSSDPSAGRSGAGSRMLAAFVEYSTSELRRCMSEREFANYFVHVAERLSVGRQRPSNQVRWAAAPGGPRTAWGGVSTWGAFSVMVLVDRNATVVDSKFNIGVEGWKANTSKRVLYAKGVESWTRSSLEVLGHSADGDVHLFSALQDVEHAASRASNCVEHGGVDGSLLWAKRAVPHEELIQEQLLSAECGCAG
jgi:hypothetical protein